MDFNVLIQFISSVGFPIACCGAMMYYVKYVTDKNREDLQHIMETHREEMRGMEQAVNNNTVALTELRVLMEKEGD